MKKEIVYVDMDNVLVDFKSGIDALPAEILTEYEDRLDEVPGIFSKMAPFENAIDSVNALSEKYDLYILSTAPWNNPSAWIDKLLWVKHHFGNNPDSLFYKRLIISHHKNLNHGKYLIDDRLKNGAEKFTGKLLLFGSKEFPN